MDSRSQRTEKNGPKPLSRFIRYVKRLFLQSTIAGIPKIVAAGNLPRRFVRILVFFSCLFGFTYQFASFLWLYWTYPMVVDIQVTNPTEIDLPAITICDHNGHYLETICNMVACTTPKNVTIFCIQYPRYCKKGVLLTDFSFPWAAIRLRTFTRMDRTIERSFYAGPEKKIITCEMQSNVEQMKKECGEVFVQPRTKGHIYALTTCYTLNSLYEKPGVAPGKISTTSAINMLLHVDPLNYAPDIPDEYVSMYIDYHSPYALSNAFRKGINIFPGRHYKMFFKERILKLLPAPFETECVDYMENWKKNMGKGPTSQSDCIEECKLKMYVDERGCANFYIWYPNDFRLCETRCEDETCPSGIPGDPLLDELSEICSKKCKPACHQTFYDVTVEEIQVSEEVFAKVPKRRDRHNYIYVTTSFDKYDATTYTYSPKFEFIETFSYLGGYIGMWLGISLVVVFDFMETLVAIVKYPFKNKEKVQRPRTYHLHY